ncbi:ribonuclease 2-like [Momordica charantia]|uniref:Ribonuclease 2-like n=1 Tax=Momordica charantia TaxID=3673 RepID=A0A6J1CGP7_MOMCH|nr:ribonuclease 2-like [Momordica charantia]
MASSSIKGNPTAAATVFLLVVLQLQAAAFAAGAAPGSEEQREFDYFVLALQWPATSCTNPGKCCPSNGCCRGAESPTEFTIHGLWPQYEEKGWPSCCSDASFSENEILSLNKDIQKYWPTYRCGTTSTCHRTKGSFWAHEYEKHGTCAAPVIVGEFDYFLTTLTIFSKYNVTKVLNDAGFVASDTEKYALGDVVAAVQDAFNATPKISCAKKGAVKELWLCFDKTFQPRDCDLANSCPDFIKLPTYEPQEANKVEGAIPWMGDAEAII